MARPRDPSLAGLATAFDTLPVEALGIDAVKLTPAQIGDAGSPTRVRAMQALSKNRACQWIEGTPSEQADALVRHLADAGLIA
jgi:electron transfer flavoprotein beta subunit